RAGHITLPDGSYLHAWAEQGDRSVHALRRIWFKPPFENQYLHRQFDAGFALEQGIVAELEPGLGPVVRDAHGRVMMHLTWADELPPPGGRSLLALLLAGAAIALAIAALWRAAAAGGAGWGPALAFTGVLLGARLATLAHGSFEALASHPLFDPSLFASSFFIPSLGDLLINAACRRCAAFPLHRAARHAPPGRPGLLHGIGAIALLFACASSIGAVMIALVHDSSVSLDLFRVQGFNGYSLAALLAI